VDRNSTEASLVAGYLEICMKARAARRPSSRSAHDTHNDYAAAPTPEQGSCVMPWC
jgi:hypothetical protein